MSIENQTAEQIHTSRDLVEKLQPPNASYWDAIIIGAGPAGASAAIESTRLGCKTLLVDAKSFPRRKVCGGCLNLVSLQHLSELLGERHPVWDKACPVTSYHLLHRQRHFRYELPGGRAIDRETLDQALVDVAQLEGVTFCAPVTASLKTCEDLTTYDKSKAANDRGQRAVARVELSTQNRSLGVFHTKSVVVASGLGGNAIKSLPHLQARISNRSRVGIAATIALTPPEFAEPGIYMAVAKEGYVGLTQVSGGRLHLAAAVDRGALQQLGPQRLVRHILDSAGASNVDLDQAHAWRGTPPLTARPQRVAQERVFLAGDAAGYIEPFTGEGLRWALSSGMAVAKHVALNRTGSPAEVATAWESWYRRTIRPSQRRCQQFAWGLRHRGTRLITHQLLAWWPQLALPIIKELNHS